MITAASPAAVGVSNRPVTRVFGGINSLAGRSAPGMSWEKDVGIPSASTGRVVAEADDAGSETDGTASSAPAHATANTSTIMGKRRMVAMVPVAEASPA